MSKIVDIWISKYNGNDTKEMACIIESLGLINKLKKSNTIVIKPNLCAGNIYTSESGVVTNIKVLDYVIRTIRDININADIFIVESDSIDNGYATLKFKKQNYYEYVSHNKNVKLLDLSRAQLCEYKTTNKYFSNLYLPDIFKYADFFISLAKIKTHYNTTISGILKNQFGCLPNIDKYYYHPYLAEVLCDINSAIKPDLCIAEGCPALEGAGPIKGNIKDLGVVIIGKDPVAVDATMARVMGFNPYRIKTLRVAGSAKLGVIENNNICVKGIDINTIMCKFNYVSIDKLLFVNIGFMLMRIGGLFTKYGHIIHNINNTQDVIRRLCLKIFNMGK